MNDEQLVINLTSETLQNIDYIRDMLTENENLEKGDQKKPKHAEIEKQLYKAYEIVKTEVQQKTELVKRLCAALSKISNDTFEIAKIAAPIIITFSLSKTISVPSEPFSIALVAIAIGRIGVAAICPEIKD